MMEIGGRELFAPTVHSQPYCLRLEFWREDGFADFYAGQEHTLLVNGQPYPGRIVEEQIREEGRLLVFEAPWPEPSAKAN